jgi:hypothetical protein
LAFLGLNRRGWQIEPGRRSFGIESQEKPLVVGDHHPLDPFKEDWMILLLVLSFTRDA